MNEQELLALCAEVAAVQKQSNEAIDTLSKANDEFKRARNVEAELHQQLEELHKKLKTALGSRF